LRTPLRLYSNSMATHTTLLCIHRDPGQLNHLKEKGYGLISATTGSRGLRLLMSQSVDAIVVEYYLGLLNGAVVADEIKKVRPRLPIVMVADDLDLPDGTLRSVDALVTKSDGSRSLLATIDFLLRTRQVPQPDGACAQAMPLHGPTGDSDGKHRRSPRS
jgi:DNA-binding response OmpR family regulator